jgi:predicted small metal-binding protein
MTRTEDCKRVNASGCEGVMTKVVRCSDIVPGCDYVARAESEDELMRKAAQHAREAHGVQTLSADLVQQVKSKIRDE